MNELVPLSRTYTAVAGAPTIAAVDRGIFERRYYAHCMGCGFCADSCCSHGVDVDGRVEARLIAEAEAIERHTGISADEWFGGPAQPDADAPGGTLRRTAVRDGYCVFHTPGGRGCMLHSYALVTGRDYHLLKPMVSTLFPVTFGGGALVVSDELEDGTLVCSGDGPTAYQAARPEIAYYFGESLVTELDSLAASTTTLSAVLASATDA
jgi:ferredoxin